ncbi:tyrosine-type recombinase/integrase [Segetibacter koreensis]|uniref:tyrosine-type recombinase/integrase n=1 Tax=Segetibacter koreensis TaxID=398037 RepID=UPI000379CDAA|nr:site-specific integrase [Segetibacter koreensis]
MYTDPEIVFTGNPATRAYVKVFISGARHRFYNGNLLNIHCFPNRAGNTVEKLRLLKQLQYELKKKLEKGWNPEHETNKYKLQSLTLKESINLIRKEIVNEDISDRYRSDLQRICKEFDQFSRDKKLTNVSIQAVDHILINDFLKSYMSSAAYYMTKRSTLSGIFTRIVQKGMITDNPVRKTSRKKVVPLLNSVYTKEQLKALINFLKIHHPNLHLCTLLMYGCFLRPHREVRLLKRKHLDDNCSIITLGGDENKGKRIRIIRVPSYVQEELLKRDVSSFGLNTYIFTGTEDKFNKDYFKTAWGRIRRLLMGEGLLKENQTIYSFRHTAAVEVYLKTKDPFRVQKAMGHSTLSVTLTYLRSLGLGDNSYNDDAPEL